MNLDQHRKIVFARYDHTRLVPVGLLCRDAYGKYDEKSKDGAPYIFISNDGAALCHECASEESQEDGPDAVNSRYELVPQDVAVTCTDCDKVVQPPATITVEIGGSTTVRLPSGEPVPVLSDPKSGTFGALSYLY